MAIYTLHRWARKCITHTTEYMCTNGLLTYIITTMMSGLDNVKSQNFSYSFFSDTMIALDWIRDVRKTLWF